MDFGAMLALGIFDSDSDDDNNEGGAGRMTDLQFRAFIKMTLTLAETTREVKEFQKTFGGWASWSGATGHFGTFIWMIPKIADATGDMEKVKQVLQDILKMDK